MFDLKEIEEWEKEIDDAKIQQHYRHQKSDFDPRRDALNRHRHRSPWRRYIECSSARKKVQKRFKMKMKQCLLRGDDHNPVPHEYKTYGWETW